MNIDKLVPHSYQVQLTEEERTAAKKKLERLVTEIAILPSKSAKIRHLKKEGLTVNQISKLTGIPYQHVRNVFHTELKRGPRSGGGVRTIIIQVEGKPVEVSLEPGQNFSEDDIAVDLDTLELTETADSDEDAIVTVLEQNDDSDQS